MLKGIPDRSTNLVRGEGFLNHTACAKQFGDVQIVRIAGRAGDDNDSSVEKFLCERQRHVQAIALRHENVRNDDIGWGLAIEDEDLRVHGGLCIGIRRLA